VRDRWSGWWSPRWRRARGGLDGHVLRDWIWAALGTLSPDDRLTVMLRYFSRCRGYQAIAAVTGVPVGTVRG
jgi:RNA polymerase sigma-70 factor (ECF subfamily)